MTSSYTSIQIIGQRLHWHSFGSLMVSGRFGTCGGGPKVVIFDDRNFRDSLVSAGEKTRKDHTLIEVF